MEAEVTQRICRALAPETVPRIDFDISPKSMRQAVAKNAAAWAETCQP